MTMVKCYREERGMMKQRLREAWQRFLRDETGAICVGDGLTVVDGVLVVDIDPAGGLTVGPDGVSGSGVSGDASAALAAANEADDTADAAQASANTALDRVSAKIRWGFASGTTNGAGDITFNHGLGVVPASVVLQPHSNLGTHFWHCVVNATDAAAVNVRLFDTTTGNPQIGLAAGFSWMAGA
jgi:hypothetical protein